MEVWTLWHPIYWLSGSIKAITALVSLYTAIILVELVPKALEIPSTAELEAANQKLQQQIAERQKAEAALRKAHDELEIRVQERTKELVKANEALQESEQQLKLALQAAKLGAWQLDLKTGELSASYQCKANFGLSSEVEFSYRMLFERIHPEDRAYVRESVSRALEQNIDYEAEYRNIWPDHSVHWILARGSAICDADGSPTRMIGVTLDISDRKRAEETLQQTTMLQRAILDSANYTIISTTVDGTILTFNRAAERLLGYTATEVVGKTTPVIIHDRNEIVQRAQQLSQELGFTIEEGFEVFVAHAILGQVDEREWTYIRKDGSRFPVLLSITALRDAHNNITGFLGIGSDISDRKQAQQALHESEQRFHVFMNNSPTVGFMKDVQGRYVYVNQRFEDIFQVKLADIRGKTDFDRFPIEVAQELSQHDQVVLSTRQTTELEETVPTPDGTLHNWLVFKFPVWDSAGQLFLGGVAIDISDRKRAEEELRHLSKALESAVEGISQLDRQGRYLKVNPAYASMLGYQSEEMIGMEWQLIVYPEDREKLSAAYQQMLTNGKSEVEARAVRKDGSVFDKQVVMVKSYEQQQFIGHYCFMKDISDRREVERLKDEFVSVVNHELRTPLTSISGALDLLASGILQTQPEDAQRMLNIAASNTDRLVRLINDILDIERIESGKIQMTKQSCDSADLIRQSVELMEEMAAQAGVTISVSSFSSHLWADPDRIIQVLTNLLSNAIKFSPPGSTIWLSAEEDAGTRGQGTGDRENIFSSSPSILFKVTDQGRGIPAEKLETVFERFGQVDASDSRQKGGTGLGLAICRSILQHHGGQIWAESTLGEGSTFFFTLPILTQEDMETRGQGDRGNVFHKFSAFHAHRLTPSSQTLSAQPPLVLECDDDPSVRVVVQTMLEQQGYRVLAVGSGQEAVEEATANNPDAIILNLMMPGMDGWETLAILKQQPHTQNIPVIILSGLLPDASKGLPEGVSDWIVKPPKIKLLCQALEKATSRQNQTLKVLIIEDDQDLAQVLIAMFNSHNITTFYAQTGREAIQVSQNIIPDLLVLDLGLPECDGFTVVDWLRQHNRLCQVPLVVYTARDLDESDRERLRLGQTLFLTKGRITPQEFEQRVINLLNRMIRGKD
ncbi:PAS domain S-box protein [Chlorogloeopsis sp. ULAP02]|uniref:PAS domain S-box protein n=1 Tax=Chlorogloeopsis sp. ULAP02 TaxID=3107926 RepID=UPI00313467B8